MRWRESRWRHAWLLIAAWAGLAAGLGLASDAAKPGIGAALVRGYGARCEPPALSEMESGVIAALNEGRRKREQALLTVDPVLCLAAAAHARQFADTREPDTFADGRGSVRYWLDASGVSTVFVTSACAKIEANAKPEAAAEALEPGLDTDRKTHVGIGSARVEDEVLITAITAARYVSLQPIPARLAPGQTCRLAGKLHEPLKGCHVLLTSPTGAMTRVAAVEGQQMDVTVRLSPGRGEYAIEIIGTTDRGPMLTDVLKLYVGVPYPKPFAQKPPPPAKRARQRTAAATEGDMAAELASRINKLRLMRDLKPLRTHSKLTKIAAYNSKELRDRKARDPDSTVADVYIKSQVRYKAYKVKLFVSPRLPKADHLRLAQIEIFSHIGVGIAKGEMDGKEVIWGTVILMAK